MGFWYEQKNIIETKLSNLPKRSIFVSGKNTLYPNDDDLILNYNFESTEAIDESIKEKIQGSAIPTNETQSKTYKESPSLAFGSNSSILLTSPKQSFPLSQLSPPSGFFPESEKKPLSK